MTNSNDENALLNRQAYLLEQKVELMGEILQDVYDTLWLIEDSYGVNLIRPKFLANLKELLAQLNEIPDA